MQFNLNANSVEDVHVIPNNCSEIKCAFSELVAETHETGLSIPQKQSRGSYTTTSRVSSNCAPKC